MTPMAIEEAIPQVRRALADRRRAVLTAPPGSGKTTLVPLRLTDEPWVRGRKILVLEPRRVAARSAARWMSRLLGETPGQTVGYVTRDDRRTGPDTRIEIVTEGVLTRRLQRHPGLDDTAAVIFDEYHERNLQTDLGLALLLDVGRGLRPDLRVVAMSATGDTSRIAALLGGGDGPAPVVTGGSRPHPVEIRWVPATRQSRLEHHVASTVRTALSSHPGDILVFLPGMGEIRRVESALSGVDAEIHLLHGALPLEQQDAALAPGTGRKVILSTDIAETSLTVEGIGVVIDSGLSRQPRFDARTGMTRLTTVPISKSSAEQRAGRAGRLGPGVAYRCWSKLEHAARKPHADPEMSQVDLAGLVLELAVWGVREPSELSFPDPPPARTFEEGRRLLTGLGALGPEGHVTDLGRAMADLPLHPRLARMVAGAGRRAALACVLAALLDERDPLRGHPDEVPVGLEPRIRAVMGPGESRALARIRRSAGDLARRVGASLDEVDADEAGMLLATAYPDRLAIRRGSPGRFRLRAGPTAWLPASDPLAVEEFLIAADLDGRRKDARIRLAAPLDPEDVATLFAAEVEESASLAWDGLRLVERLERRLGGIVLDACERRPEAGPRTRAAILDRIRHDGLSALPWTTQSRRLRDRVAFLHRTREGWPDWSDAALLRDLDEWLGPHLEQAAGLEDVESLDLSRILRRRLGHPHTVELDTLAPTHVTVPSGRRRILDYSSGAPVLRVRVQEMFGCIDTPRVAGTPVVLELLSPADRPVQTTADLAGFWRGSWREVRKDMAGRYPKHRWPEDPESADPV